MAFEEEANLSDSDDFDVTALAGGIFVRGLLTTGLGVAAFFFGAVLDSFLTSFFEVGFTTDFFAGAGFLERMDFSWGKGFLIGTAPLFFFGAGFKAVFLEVTALLRVATGLGLAFPWAAFFLVLLDLLTCLSSWLFAVSAILCLLH